MTGRDISSYITKNYDNFIKNIILIDNGRIIKNNIYFDTINMMKLYNSTLENNEGNTTLHLLLYNDDEDVSIYVELLLRVPDINVNIPNKEVSFDEFDDFDDTDVSVNILNIFLILLSSDIRANSNGVVPKSFINSLY